MPHPSQISRLRQLREAQGWSQAELARRLDTNVLTIWRWEKGSTKPGLHYRKKLCDVFKCSQQELRFGIGNQQDGLADEELSITNTSDEEHLYSPFPPVALREGLIGRDTLIQTVRAQLERESNVAVTALRGLPGVGKTALAVAIAHDPLIRQRFPDGILWAGLGPAPSIPVLLRSWGRALGISSSALARAETMDALSRLIRAMIDDKRLLLVIDDAWQIEAALPFKVGGSNCAHLLTTRFAPVAHQFAHEHTIVVEELSAEDGIALLTRLAPEAVAFDREQAQALVEKVGGLPLALTILGHALQAMHQQPRRIRTLLAQMQQAEKRLQWTEPYAPSERPPSLPAGMALSVQSAIDVSIQHLTYERAQEVLTEAWDLAQGQGWQVQCHVLSSLGLCYMKQGNMDAAQDCYRQGLALTPTHEPTSEKGRFYQALGALAGNQGDFRAAQSAFIEALCIARTLDSREDICMNLMNLGGAASDLEEWEQARSYMHESLVLAKQLGYQEIVAKILGSLGQIAAQNGDYQLAYTYLQESLDTARRIGVPEKVGLALQQMGLCLLGQGRWEDAMIAFCEGEHIMRVLHHRQLASLLYYQGIVALRQHYDDQAMGYFAEACSCGLERGDRGTVAKALYEQAKVYTQRGEWEMARLKGQESLHFLQELHHPLAAEVQQWIEQQALA